MARYLVMFHPGDPVPDRIKYVDDGSAPPDADDDAATLGVTVGSIFIDTTNHKAYLCESAGTGTAEWLDLTGAAASALDDLSDVTLTDEATGDAIVYDGSAWVNVPSARHLHIVGEPVTLDGSATVYYLANQAESDSVAAYDTDGARVGITHDEDELDKVTFDSTPAAGSGLFDYVAATS